MKKEEQERLIGQSINTLRSINQSLDNDESNPIVAKNWEVIENLEKIYEALDEG